MPNSMFGIHWIPAIKGPFGNTSDAEAFRDLRVDIIKIVSVDEKIPYLDEIPSGCEVVVRNHPMSELYGSRTLMRSAGVFANDEEANKDKYETYFETYFMEREEVKKRRALAFSNAVLRSADPLAAARRIGAEHAAVCVRMADNAASKGFDKRRLIFEGLNEPTVWSDGEPPDAVAAYYKEFLIELHRNSLRGAIGNFSVGQPPDTSLAFFKPAVDVMHNGDYLALHEYWAFKGPSEGWGWWGGRCLKHPYKVPMLITETGIDGGVLGSSNQYQGWQNIPADNDENRAGRYVEELIWYMEKLKADGRVQAIFPFTWGTGSYHWDKFNMRTQPLVDALKRNIDRVAIAPGKISVVTPPPPPPPQPADLTDTLLAIRNAAWNMSGVPYNPAAAFVRHAAKKDYGRPVTPEFDLVISGQAYRVQAFEKRVLAAKVGDWANIIEVPWLG